MIYVVIVLAAFLAGMCRISDTDFWWHLKTGDLIAATHSIPRRDVYSFTARGHEYIDHEWLFQVMQHGAFAVGGPAGVAILKSGVIAITFCIVAWYCLKHGANQWVVLGLVALGIAGAMPRLIERPEVYSTLFLVLTIVLLEHKRGLIAIPIITALWANIHAAVILGLIVQMLFILAERKRIVPLAITFAASVAAACLNPFGYRVLLVPFELTRIIDSRILTNTEWLMPTLRTAPVFWIVLIVTAITIRKPFQILLFLFTAYLALHYVRNVGLFCTVAPMLIGAGKRIAAIAGAVVFAIAITVLYPFEHGIGVSRRFPVTIATSVERNALRGNMYNTDWLGGYLIWKLYPQRSVFIDGRNEVYVPLLKRLGVAEVDSREWTALLRDYAIEYALVAYNDEPNTITTIGPDGKASTSQAPASAVRFPRSQWALTDWDDSGMLYVRRRGANAITSEYRFVYPEVPGFLASLVSSGRIPREAALAELRRKLQEQPDCWRARALSTALSQSNPGRTP